MLVLYLYILLSFCVCVSVDVCAEEGSEEKMKEKGTSIAQNFAIIQYETEKVTAHCETERAWCTTTERTRVHHKIEWTTVHYRTERTIPLIFHLALVL